MKKDPDTRIKRETKNVFADLGFPDAETHLLKAELVTPYPRSHHRARADAGRGGKTRGPQSTGRFATAQWATPRRLG